MMFVSVSCFAQINTDILEEMRTSPDPFDKSRISYYINSAQLNPYDFEGQYQRGLLNMENGFYEEAIANFRHLIIPQPDIVGAEKEMPDPYFYIGLCKTLMMEYDSAMFYLNKAININPAYAAAYGGRGGLYLISGEYSEALSDFERAFMYDAQDPKAMYNIGYTYFLKGDYEAARSHIRKAIRKFPDFHLNQLLLGLIYMYESEPQKAIKYFTESIALYPNNTLAYFNRGLIKIGRGLVHGDMTYMAEGKADMDMVIKVDSTFVEAYQVKFLLGMVFNDLYSMIENDYLVLKYSFLRYKYQEIKTSKDLEKYYLLGSILKNTSLPDEERKLGEEYFEADYGDMEMPIMPLIEYSRQVPNSMFIKRLIAYYFYDIQDTDQAESALFSVLLMDSSLLHLKSTLAEIYMEQEMEKQALDIFEQILDADSSNGSFYYQAGNAYYKANEIESAYKYYSRTIELLPHYMNAYMRRAKICLMEGRLKEALKDFSFVHQLDPDNVYAWYMSGNIYNTMEKPDSALIMLDVAKELTPDYGYIYAEMADSYLALNKPELVEELFNQFIEANDRSSYSYVVAGQYFLSNLDSLDKAEKYFNLALKINPESAVANNAMGDFYCEKNANYIQAIEYYDKASWYNEKYYSPVKSAAWCSYKLEQYDNALEYCDLAIMIDSTGAYPHNLKGLIYQQLENNEMALKFFLQATEINNEYANAWGNAGWTSYLLGDYQKCIEYSEKAIELDDEAYYAMANIALTHLRLGEVERALEEYKDYHEKVSLVEDYDYSGAIKDLEDLIDKGIMVEEAQNILETFFAVEE